MTTTPYAKTTMKIDGGPHVSGAQLVAGGNVVQLLGESTVNWNNQLWQIYEYPPGYALPAGWTNNNGIYECTLVVPPTFTIDATSSRWGKYLTRLIVNNGILAGVYAGPGTAQPLVDLSGVIQTKSPKLGLTDIAFQETNQFDPVRQWVGELKTTLRAIDSNSGGAALPVTRTRRTAAAASTITTADDLVEVTAAASPQTLPSAPLDGQQYEVCNNTSGNNNVLGNGHNFNATGNATFVLGPYQALTATYSSGSLMWLCS